MAKPSTKELAHVILSLSNKVSAKSLATNVANYLQEERRSGDLESIMKEVKELRRKKQGIVEANVTTAFPVDSSTTKKIKQIFGDNVLINEIIDKHIIGGVRVETNEDYLDLTVRGRLNQLKRAQQGVAIQ